MNQEVEINAELVPAIKKKFLVEYRLPYEHLVRVGIEAETEKSAIEIAEQSFADATIWDNTPEMPLLYDDYEETGNSGDVLEFKVVDEFEQWPEPEVCVRLIERDAAAKRACECLIAAYENSDSPYENSDSPSVRDALLQSALEEAHAAMPHLFASNGVPAVSVEKATAVIYLDGGVVQWVSSDRPMRYLVLDTDTDGTEPIEVTMENGDIAQVLPTETVLADHQPEWVLKLLAEV